MPKPSSALGLDTSYPAASTSSSANLSHSADQDREYWENIVVPILLKHYHKNVHPSVEERNAIAAEMGVTPQSVEDWFRNRRYRQRRAQGPGALVQSPVSKKYPYEYKRLGVEEKQRLEEEFLKDSNMRQDRRVRSVARKLGVDEKTMADWYCFSRHRTIAHAGIDYLLSNDRIGQSPSLASTLQDANTPLTIRCPVER
ncbi:hypothetical protein C8Q80DRAFT_1186101 [Daedaleopsis nitida]|nr:hypothetical protein C8Q80DRAFT_1186101 [Daedaleopsis nitida]